MNASLKHSKQTSGRPRVVRNLPALRRAIAALSAPRRLAKNTLALVPTMGALHRGHLSLIGIAQRRAAATVVSIFVNPAQFAANEDFSKYPRTWSADLAALGALNVDLVWAPDADTMYPSDFATHIVPEGPAKAGLEDAFRPHFFGGVATVVAKLLIQCEPDIAIFGEKDYQQLKVLSQLARDLDLKTRIVGGPIVREPDGLALSSRNVYLSPREREAAPTLYRVLKACADRHCGRRAARRHLTPGPRCNSPRRLRARLSGSAPRPDAGANCLAERRTDPPPGGGADRADAFDR